MKRQLVRIRGHHLVSLREDYYAPFLTNVFPLKEYSEEHKRRVREIFDLIKFGNVDVTVIDCLDDICHADCNLLDDSCTNDEVTQNDKNVAKGYGFEINKVYHCSEIISKLCPNG